MGNFKSYKDIIKELSDLGSKLDSGELDESELEKIQVLSKNLYERAIVLNYKAKEERVFTSSKSEKSSSENSIEDANSTEGSRTDIENNDYDEENEKVEQEKPKSQENSKESEELFSFDFSEEETKPHNSEVKQESESVIESSEEKQTEEEKKVEEQEYDAVSEEVDEVEPEKPKNRTTVTTEKATHISSDDKTVSFYERFTQVHDQSLLDVLASQKIESLKGAFGLNDRLQIINDLFDGESERFSQAVESLDNQSTSENARRKLSEIAAQHQWEPDNKVVENFVKMVERRYAE